MRSTFAALSILFSVSAWAQAPASDAPPEPPPAAEAPAAAPAEPPAPVAEGCRPLTDKAMAADLKALTAQSQKAEPGVLVQLYSASTALWGRAVEVCEGRAKDRAQRNLAESQKATTALNEQLGNAPECGAAHKDAAMLQDLARSALSERRWADAASMFHKAEDMWDVAVDRCTGSQKDIAERRLAQAETDGYNAEFCAPLFDRAREYTQKLRANAAGISREEKNEGLMVAETLWREAKEQCKGSAAQESARNNAQALARERGTPWVPRSVPTEGTLAFAVAAAAPAKAPPAKAPAPAPAATATAPTAAAATAKAEPTSKEKAVAALEWNANSAASAAAATTSTLAGTTALTAASTAAPAKAAAETTAAAGSGLSSLVSSFLSTTAARPAEPAKPQTQPESFAVGDMRFKGQFVRDADAPTFSGTGQLSWANGDVFEGTLQKGKRHGKGQFTWANGQRYNGDWVQDVPTGQAVVDFANANHYEGAVTDSVPEGSGRMAYASGDSYVGQFKRGEPEGSGSYIWKNGQKFEGNWKGGKPNGEGKLVYANGDRYEGLFKDGEPDQKGTFTWVNGDRYNGEWKVGAKEGKGVFTWANGDRWEGVFQNDAQTANGELIRKTP